MLFIIIIIIIIIPNSFMNLLFFFCIWFNFYTPYKIPFTLCILIPRDRIKLYLHPKSKFFPHVFPICCNLQSSCFSSFISLFFNVFPLFYHLIYTMQRKLNLSFVKSSIIWGIYYIIYWNIRYFWVFWFDHLKQNFF